LKIGSEKNIRKSVKWTIDSSLRRSRKCRKIWPNLPRTGDKKLKELDEKKKRTKFEKRQGITTYPAKNIKIWRRAKQKKTTREERNREIEGAIAVHLSTTAAL